MKDSTYYGIMCLAVLTKSRDLAKALIMQEGDRVSSSNWGVRNRYAWAMDYGAYSLKERSSDCDNFLEDSGVWEGEK